jgi:hypothetical protein
MTSAVAADFDRNGISLHGPRASNGDSADRAAPGRRVDFINPNRHTALELEDLLPGTANFFIGSDPGKWLTDLPTYAALRYRNLWPKIDLEAKYEGSSLQAHFVLWPGSDPSDLGLRLAGASGMRVDGDGALFWTVGDREFKEPTLRGWQEDRGRQWAVAVRYEILADGEIGIELGRYKPSLPVKLGFVLTFSTLLSGSGMDAAAAVAVNQAGEVFLAGYSESTDLPVRSAMQTANRGGVDAWVAKLNPNGNSFQYITYLGGAGEDRAQGIAAGSDGSVVVVGYTISTDFPLKSAAMSFHGGGGKDAFAARLGPLGNTLTHSSYLGGAGADNAAGVALDLAGNAFIAGASSSKNLPVVNAYQAVNRGGQDAFLAKLSPSGSIASLTYLGGSRDDRANSVAIDPSGQAYLTGGTDSGDFPTLASFQSALRGAQDAFAAKLSADGRSLLYATYLGGTGGASSTPEAGYGIAVDSSGSAYLTGTTNSSDFPISGAHQPYFAGGIQDAFLVKLTPGGNALLFSTYVGGTSQDTATSIALDGSGDIYIAGHTYSKNFPTLEAFQSSPGYLQDAFLARFDKTSGALRLGTYLGGNSSDAAYGVTVDRLGQAWVAGTTNSTDFPINPPSGAYAPLSNAFVVKVGAPPAAVSVTPSSGSGSIQTFTFRYSDPNGAGDLLSMFQLINSDFIAAGGCYFSYWHNSRVISLAVDSTGGWVTAPPGAGVVLQGDSCSIDTALSHAVQSGSNMDLSVAITFSSKFAGAKRVYMQAYDGSGQASALLQAGTYYVATGNLSPAAISATPPAGSGTSQVFTFRYSDPNGASDLMSMFQLINNEFNAHGGCYFTYWHNSRLISLAVDSTGGWVSASPGSGAVLQGNSCAIHTNQSSVLPDGSNLDITVAITFSSGFSGTKTLYMQAYDSSGVQSPLLQAGTFQVTSANMPPSAVSVTPSAGSGSNQTFVFRYSDHNGSGDLLSLYQLINTGFNGPGGCYFTYWHNTHLISLAVDSTGAWVTAAPGSGIILQGDSCAINTGLSSVVLSGNSIDLTVAITFTSKFAGPKTIYMQGYDKLGAPSALLTAGTYTVTSMP